MSENIGWCKCKFRESSRKKGSIRRCNTKMLEYDHQGYGGWCSYRCPYCGGNVGGLTQTGQTHYCHHFICTVCGKIAG